MKDTEKKIEKKISAIIDEFIARDEPNNLFDVYEEQTGKEPVPEEGGHTEEFTLWFVTKVRKAVKSGCNTVEAVIAFIRSDEKILKIYKEIGTSKDYLVELIGAYEDSLLGGISRDYSKSIAEAIADDVAQDIHETADHEDWNMDDVRLAVGRVLCAKLGVIQ